jgi:hypothetical protein
MSSRYADFVRTAAFSDRSTHGAVKFLLHDDRPLVSVTFFPNTNNLYAGRSPARISGKVH